jgi:hypothetical protein
MTSARPQSAWAAVTRLMIGNLIFVKVGRAEAGGLITCFFFLRPVV